MNARALSQVQTSSSPSFTPAPVNIVQRKCVCGGSAGLSGECADCQKEKLVGDSASLVQPKLKIGQPNDEYEQEADRVADEVMRMPEPKVQREVESSAANNKISPAKLSVSKIMPLAQKRFENESDKEVLKRNISSGNLTVQRNINEENAEETTKTKHLNARASIDTSEVQSGIKSLQLNGGKPLPNNVRDFMESRFHDDFSQVRVHTNNQAAQIAKRLQAQAFTIGRDIVMGQGMFRPNSINGKRLLAHELTHSVQQRVSQPGTRVPTIQRLEESENGGGPPTSSCPPLPDPNGDWAYERWLCEMRQEPLFSNKRVLASGASGRSVALVHQVLQHWLCKISETETPKHTLPDPTSISYTVDSSAVVLDFQRFSHAILKEGIVGPETIGLLDGYVGGPDVPPVDCGIPETETAPVQEQQPAPTPEPSRSQSADLPGVSVPTTTKEKAISGVGTAVDVAGVADTAASISAAAGTAANLLGAAAPFLQFASFALSIEKRGDDVEQAVLSRGFAYGVVAESVGTRVGSPSQGGKVTQRAFAQGVQLGREAFRQAMAATPEETTSSKSLEEHLNLIHDSVQKELFDESFLGILPATSPISGQESGCKLSWPGPAWSGTCVQP